MAYPNIPGRLPRSPYTDTSAKSMSIASPRAGHVDTSPHTQAPYTQLADPIGSRRLPSDLYSGMPSTQNLSPYNDTCLSPHDLRMPIHHTVDRSTGELVYPSNHTDMRRSQHGHVNTSSRALQRDYKMPVEQSVMERADRSSQGDHMSMFGLREMQPDITGDNKDIQIGAEDADSDSEWDDMDAFNREYPPSVRLHLKAILDEKKDAVSAAPETEAMLRRQLAKHPKDPLLIDRFRRHREWLHVHELLMNLHNKFEEAELYLSRRDEERASQSS